MTQAKGPERSRRIIDPEHNRGVIDPERSRASIPLSTTLSANRTGRKIKDPERSRRIRVRYAPSPTGIPHIGNIRTALFNYLFAKNQKGTFILRIEDTDQKRLVPNAVEKIRESLSVLSLDPDEEYHQSKRLDIYNKHLEILKTKGLAYEEEGAWRFKVKKGKYLKWKDAVHGEISINSDVVEDFIIVKSDGFPTYHFASVVDDHDMQISHVFRGDEWISSTPKHLLLYESFDWGPPQFVHMPPILGANKKKLSKREGAKSVMEYIEEGYLPEAIINFMAFLGWAPKDNREIFPLEDLIKEFSLDRINKNSPIFSLEKLAWFNNQWLKKLEVDELAKIIVKKIPKYSKKQILPLIPLVNSRMTTILDFPKLADFIFTKPNIEKSILDQIPVSGHVFEKLVTNLEKISNWNRDTIKQSVVDIAQSEKMEPKGLFRSIGIAISGSLVTPPLFECLEILEKEETISRLKDLLIKKK